MAGMLRIAIVGHTNTGKTSLLRTLMRSVDFGTVSGSPGSTRHAEAAALVVGGAPAIELVDTPGLEESSALLEFLDGPAGAGDGSGHRTARHEALRVFLDHPAAASRFTQEAKVIRQMLACDVALYVIDARERVLGRHEDELEILSRAGRPLVPVLNFTAAPDARTAAWRERLARGGLHAVAAFDTVAFNDADERSLFEKIRTLVHERTATINAYLAELAERRDRLRSASLELMADMLVDAAALVIAAPADDRAALDMERERLREAIRLRERRAVEAMLRLHRFRPEDCAHGAGQLLSTQLGHDVFSPAALKQFGIRAGTGAAAGAAAGLVIDAMVGGMTLGAAAATGAIIGMSLGAARTHGRRALDRLRGRSELRLDDPTLALLAARQLALLRVLEHRGHAALDPIELRAPGESAHVHGRGGMRASDHADGTPRAPWSKLPPELDAARQNPQWSCLAEAQPLAAPIVLPLDRRSDAVAALAQRLMRAWRDVGGDGGGAALA